MKSDPLAAHRKVESLTGEGFLRRELALALRVSSREEETRRKKKKRRAIQGQESRLRTELYFLSSSPVARWLTRVFVSPRAPRARSATEAVAWTSCWG